MTSCPALVGGGATPDHEGALVSDWVTSVLQAPGGEYGDLGCHLGDPGKLEVLDINVPLLGPTSLP